MSKDDYLSIMRHEFDGENGSFLNKLRCAFVWDKDAFAQLVEAMRLYLLEDPVWEKRERWIAEGFWYLDWFVKKWASHPNFPRPFSHEYYQDAFERLHDLAWWYFVGERTQAESEFCPIEN